MEENPDTLKNTLDDWLERHFHSGYTSCIKINGRPILPPLMSEECRIEMRRLRDMAIEVENRVARKTGSTPQDDNAGGEAMYEGVVEELYFANSLPSSLTANVEIKQPLPNLEISGNNEDNQDCKQAPVVSQTSDMLEEFDPLAEQNHSKVVSPLPVLDINSGDFAEKRSAEKTISKPSSAESSVALSYSTDLNNYMDITEGSVDISVPDSDFKSCEETGTITPSTVRPDSADNKSYSSAPWRNGKKSAFEDLNNYLDSLLNNSETSMKSKFVKDNNQNVVTCSVSPSSSQSTLSPRFSEEPKSFNSNLPPLKSPPGSLQTKHISECEHLRSPAQKNLESIPSDFLQNCALSPVVRGDTRDLYEQKVQLYLQNLMTEENAHSSSLWQMQNLVANFKETSAARNFPNTNDVQITEQGNWNAFSSVPPRLVRSNSYTLDSPSPMLLAHMEAELRNNARNETDLSQSAGSSRRVWDVEASKIMPSWCTRQANSPNVFSKTQSPKKVFNRIISAQQSSSVNSGRSGAPIDVTQKQLKSKVSSKNTKDQPEVRKPNITSRQNEAYVKKPESSSQDVNSLPSGHEDTKDSVRTLLHQLQVQHKLEMEELLGRQHMEKEAIRLALLDEQGINPWKTSDNMTCRPPISQAPGNPIKNAVSQSPPTKDKALISEKRTTSPSIYHKENSDALNPYQTEKIKGSCTSMENVTTTSENNTLIDLELGCEAKQLSSKVSPHHLPIHRDAQKSSTSGVVGLCRNESALPNNYGGISDMTSSFPPGDHVCSSQLESMTSSLPPEFLSLQFSKSDIPLQNGNSEPQKDYLLFHNINKPVSVGMPLMAQNILSPALGSNIPGGSPQSKRRSWCSRQLFPDELVQNHPDWVTQSQEVIKHQAAARIQAGVRGYLTRRLLKTERVQNYITTIRDTIVCAIQLQHECAPNVEPSDLQLHGRLIQQLSAACEDLHNIFMGLPVKKRMTLIAVDRERLRVRTPRSRSSTGSRCLSRATEIAMKRRMNQTDQSDSNSVLSRSSSANRSRRRSWAVESHVQPPAMITTNNCEVVTGCLSRSSAPTSLLLQRSASVGSSRKPWR